MKRLSFIPEIFIWLTFSVVAGFGYAFSFFEYVSGHAQMSVMDIVIPTLVWMLLAAICTFLLRIAQNTQCFTRFSRAESLFLECSVFALLLIGGWVFRFVEHFNGIWPAEPDNSFFQFAEVSQQAVTYMNPHPASRLYVGFLHIICLFMGNIYEIGAVVQFILLLLAVFIWYLAVRKAFGAITALFFVGGAMLLPDSITASVQCNPMMLLFVMYGLIMLLVVNYAMSMRTGFCMVLVEVVLGMLCMLAVFMDISGFLILAALGIAVRYRKRNCVPRPRISPLPAWVGILAAGGLIPMVQARIYGMSFLESALFMGYTHMQYELPGLKHVKEFVFSLGTHPVFIAAIVVISIYWFLPVKQAFTWIMLAVLYLFGLQFFHLDMYLQHDFAIYMCLAVLLGISVKQYLAMTDRNEIPVMEELLIEKHPMEEREEPVVTVIHFEEEPAVTVPEKPLIFIPKSMEIPKRVSKPKVDFALEISADKLHYDYEVDDNSDYDIS